MADVNVDVDLSQFDDEDLLDEVADRVRDDPIFLHTLQERIRRVNFDLLAWATARGYPPELVVAIRDFERHQPNTPAKLEEWRRWAS